MPELFSLTEASKKLGIHRQTLWRAARAGQLPAAKIGRKWYVDLSNLPAYIEKQAERRAQNEADKGGER